MTGSHTAVHRVCIALIALVAALMGRVPVSSAQPKPGTTATSDLPADYMAQILAPEWRSAFPHRSAFGSLCSLGPLACALIDRPFAFNAHLELFIRPAAPDGSTALLLPFGLSVPLFGRAEVGVSSCYAGFWAGKETADRLNADPSIRRPGGLCPLTLAGKLLLFPWFRDPHKNGALALEYQLEHRAGPFDGVNQLGLPGSLSKLGLAYRHPIGRLELSGSSTVLVDHTSRAGTLQLGIHVGYRLPVGEHFWVFGQAMAQVPSWGPVLTDYASRQTLNLAPPISGTLAAGLQQRADFGFGVGMTLMLTKSELDTRIDVLLRLLSFEVGPHIKPVWRAKVQPETPPKVEVAIRNPAMAAVCPEGMRPIEPATAPPGTPQTPPQCERIPRPSWLAGHPCYLAPVSGSQRMRMGTIDVSGQYCDWDGLRLPLGAVISPPKKAPPTAQRPASSSAASSTLPPPETTAGAPVPLPAVPNAAMPPPTAAGTSALPHAEGPSVPRRTASPSQKPPLPANPIPSPASNPRPGRPNGERVERTREEPPSVPGSAFLSGFVDRADTTVQHAKDIYREVKAHGIAVVLPSDQEAAEWLRRVKEDCLEHLDDCLKEKAEKAADELNTFRKKSREEQLYTAGGWAFDALVGTAATVVTPGGGAAASAAMKEGERAAAKRVGKAALKKAGAELGEEAVEHADAAVVRKARREAQNRAAKEAAEHAEREAAERAEHAATTKLEADGRARVQRMQPEPVADGAHTTFVRDPKTGKVYKYQEWDKDDMPIRRADVGSNSSRPSPHTHFPAGPDHMHTYTPPNKAPDGRVFPGQEASARNLEPHEVPK